MTDKDYLTLKGAIVAGDSTTALEALARIEAKLEAPDHFHSTANMVPTADADAALIAAGIGSCTAQACVDAYAALTRMRERAQERDAEIAEQSARESAWARKFDDQSRHFGVRLDNAIRKRDAEIARLRGAWEAVGVGGNHLASALIGWLGAGNSTFPPYTASLDEARKVICDIPTWDAWVCWRAIMQARDIIDPPDPPMNRTAEAKPEAPNVIVAGGSERSISDQERACLCLIEEEQWKPLPNNALISTLCEAVRLQREYASAMRGGSTIRQLFEQREALDVTQPEAPATCPRCGDDPCETREAPAKVNNQSVGMYGKFIVRRVDGSDVPGGKHDGCRYFVLDATHDPFSRNALYAYAQECQNQYPLLARDVRKMAQNVPEEPIIRAASSMSAAALESGADCEASPEAPAPATECASIDTAKGSPTEGEELPWYRAAKVALATPCSCTELREAIPESFYAALPIVQRVQRMAEQWNRCVGVNQKLESNLDAASLREDALVHALAAVKVDLAAANERAKDARQVSLNAIRDKATAERQRDEANERAEMAEGKR